MCIACLYLGAKKRGKLFAAADCSHYQDKLQFFRNQDLFVGKKLRLSINQKQIK